jgi:hypothetical protein
VSLPNTHQITSITMALLMFVRLVRGNFIAGFRGPEGTLYLIVDPESAAFVLLKPVIELLEEIHPRLPATFFRHFVGSLNRWVRVYDYHDAEDRVDMLDECTKAKRIPSSTKCRTLSDEPQNV